MMKITLFLLIACLAVAFSRPLSMRDVVKSEQFGGKARGEFGKACYDLKCVKTNEECGSIDYEINSISTGCLAETDVCNITTESTTDYTRGTCVPAATAGQRCDNLECGIGLACQYSLTLEYSVCVNVVPQNVSRGPGEPCGASNVVCRFYSSSTFTIENVCNSGTCKFTADGSSCTGSEQCNSLTSYCGTNADMTSTCKPYLALNAACTTNSSDSTYLSCQDELRCIPSSVNSAAGTCREEYSQKKGGACTGIKDCKDGVCADPATENTLYGVCKNYRKTSTLKKKCVTNDDCTSSNGEYCQCNGDGDSKCSNYYPDRFIHEHDRDNSACFQKAEEECAYLELDDRGYYLCLAKTCKSDMCKYYKNVKNAVGFNDNIYVDLPFGSCDFVQLCDASGLFASLPFLAVIATIVMLLQ